MAMWNREATSLLIDLYQMHPCLYQTKHPNYFKRGARQAALEEIVRSLVDFVQTSVAEVKIKLNNIRTQFKIQHYKVEDSMRSGVSTDEVYIPTLWYYNKLLFLKEHIQPRKSKSNLDAVFSLDLSQPSGSGSSDLSQDESIEMLVPVVDTSFVGEQEAEMSVDRPQKRRKTSTTTDDTRKCLNNATEALKLVLDNSKKKENKYAEFGRYVAYCINELSSETLQKQLKLKLSKVIVEYQELDINN